MYAGQYTCAPDDVHVRRMTYMYAGGARVPDVRCYLQPTGPRQPAHYEAHPNRRKEKTQNKTPSPLGRREAQGILRRIADRK